MSTVISDEHEYDMRPMKLTHQEQEN